MARLDLQNAEMAVMGSRPLSADVYFELGMMYSSGRSVPTDFIAAHKWFNLAAMNGSEEAKFHRAEVAEELTKAEMAKALKQARRWMATN